MKTKTTIAAALALLITGSAAQAYYYRQHDRYWVDCGPLSVPEDRVLMDTSRCNGVACY